MRDQKLLDPTDPADSGNMKDPPDAAMERRNRGVHDKN
jgi:hypothetical protein